MKNFAIAALIAVLVSGCATTSGLEATSERSGFDDAQVVTIAPHGNACTNLCTIVGAQWNSKKPDFALLEVGTIDPAKYSMIQKVSVRIGDEVVDLNSAQVLTRHKKNIAMYESTKDFAVPLTLVRRMTDAKEVWFRISTERGFVDDYMISGGKDSKAFNAMKRFLAEIDKK